MSKQWLCMLAVATTFTAGCQRYFDTARANDVLAAWLEGASAEKLEQPPGSETPAATAEFEISSVDPSQSILDEALKGDRKITVDGVDYRLIHSEAHGTQHQSTDSHVIVAVVRLGPTDNDRAMILVVVQ